MNLGFSFSGSGILKAVNATQTKAGKTIYTAIVEVPGQYTETIPVKLFGKLADEAASWPIGSVLDIEGRVGGREWNGKFYTDVVARGVTVKSQAGQRALPTTDAPAPSDDGGEVPF